MEVVGQCVCVLISGRKDSRGRKGVPEQHRDEHEINMKR